MGWERAGGARGFRSKGKWTHPAAGVRLELAQRVTGHETTDVVLKHYFRPGQEDFRQALEGAMPKLLTMGNGGQKLKAETLKAEIVVGPAEKTAKREMRNMLGKVKPKKLQEELLKIWERL